MKYLHFPAELARTPIRLTKEELKEPTVVVKQFFNFYNLNHIRLELGNLLEYAFGSEDEGMKKAVNRVNLIQFGYQLEALLEAVYLLHSTKQPSAKGKEK